MKTKISRGLSIMLLILSLAPTQSVFATDSIRTVEGRISNLHDPVDKRDAATKNYVDNKIEGIQNPPVVLQTEGKSETAVISQKAVSDIVSEQREALQNHIDKTVDKKLLRIPSEAVDPNDITL